MNTLHYYKEALEKWPEYLLADAVEYAEGWLCDTYADPITQAPVAVIAAQMADTNNTLQERLTAKAILLALDILKQELDEA